MRLSAVVSIVLLAASLGAACGSSKGGPDAFSVDGGTKDATATKTGADTNATDGGESTSPGAEGGVTLGGDGSTGPCVSKTCAELGYNCGPNTDGCGNPIQCGSCTAPQFCGGGGFSVCGGIEDAGAACVPRTCQQAGVFCGPTGDGCGNMLSCGSCQAPESCGGGGMPGVCGSSIPCTGLCQNQVQCPNGGTTSLTGQVVAGTLPTYGSPDPVPNVLVYVPNGTVQPFTPGVQCSQCGADVSGDPLIETLTDYKGNFTLTNVPVPPSGMVPLVIQLGRWRKYVNLSFPVTACAANTAGQITMPRTETEGDIPLTAISTGNVDALECVLLKMGIDQSEFTLPGGSGRVQMYLGNGANIGASTPPESSLTNSTTALGQYDQVLFPCWGEDPIASDPDYAAEVVKTPAQQANVINYTSAGGRMFATHFSYAWTYNDPPFSTTANWIPDQEPDTSVLAGIQQTPTEVGTFYAWMNNLGPFDNGSLLGLFTVNEPRDDFSAINPATSELWIASPAYPLLFTFNTPVGQASQCGRVIYSTFHVTVVNNSSDSTMGTTFPAECTTSPMSAQEKALEYLIWDLASCVPPPPTTMCTPQTCAEQNIGCGPAGDGCGNLIQCGMCTAPQTCGGGGVNGQCGYIDGGSCTPQTCAGLGIQCGPAGDGCGNTLQCGACVSPQTCGGGGVAGQCGSASQ
jgi:hypothetical protein